MADDNLRRFVISFYPSDDSVAINEESVPNSGFPGGLFHKKDKIYKKQVDPNARPIYYQADDFYVGAHIRASGKIFELTDADPYVSTFMNDHPELYSEEHIQAHKDGMFALHTKQEYPKEEEDNIVEKMRKCVIKNYGTSPYPFPNALNLGSDLQSKEKVQEELYCANLPIPQTLINTVIDLYTDVNNRTNLGKLRDIFLPALGHKH